MELKNLLETYENLSFQGGGLTDQQLYDFVHSIKQNLKNAFQDSMNELVEKLDREIFKTVYNVINKNFNGM